MLVVPADGTLALAEFLAGGRALFPTMGLFINNVIPDHTFTLGSLVEASFPGYARQVMGAPAPPVNQADGSALMTWSPVVFSNSAPGPGQVAYGYFVVMLDSSAVLRLLWLERMSPSVDFGIAGTNLSVSAQLVDQTLFG